MYILERHNLEMARSSQVCSQLKCVCVCVCCVCVCVCVCVCSQLALPTCNHKPTTRPESGRLITASKPTTEPTDKARRNAPFKAFF